MTYVDLHEWSVNESAAFWELLAEFAGVVFHRPADTIKGPDRMPGTEWFAGARLNYAENLLRYRDDRTAIIAANEAGGYERYSYSQLYQAAAKCARALRGLGIGHGRPRSRIHGERLPKPSWRCWAARQSGRSGARARPISARRRPWTGWVKSDRACCLRATNINTAASVSIAWRPFGISSGRSKR